MLISELDSIALTTPSSTRGQCRYPQDFRASWPSFGLLLVSTFNSSIILLFVKSWLETTPWTYLSVVTAGIFLQPNSRFASLAIMAGEIDGGTEVLYVTMSRTEGCFPRLGHFADAVFRSSGSTSFPSSLSFSSWPGGVCFLFTNFRCGFLYTFCGQVVFKRCYRRSHFELFPHTWISCL